MISVSASFSLIAISWLHFHLLYIPTVDITSNPKQWSYLILASKLQDYEPFFIKSDGLGILL